MCKGSKIKCPCIFKVDVLSVKKRSKVFTQHYFYFDLQTFAFMVDGPAKVLSLAKLRLFLVDGNPPWPLVSAIVYITIENP